MSEKEKAAQWRDKITKKIEVCASSSSALLSSLSFLFLFFFFLCVARHGADPLSIDVAQTHKELQMKELPELIKLIKAWEVAINGTAIVSFLL
jgi:hypothetical protein